MKYFNLFLFISLLQATLCTAELRAQESSSYINRSPEFLKITTPTVASFNKFIDHPVNLYSGTPDISLPIYELSDGDIGLQATLRYNASGIRVAEEASWVGLGWNLNIGGYISQQVVGEDDYNDSRYLDFVDILTPQVYSSPYQAIPYTEALHAKMECYRNQSLCERHMGKLNPDVFYFSVPGYSGKFVIDYTQNNKVVLLNREQDIDIQVYYVSSTSSRIEEIVLTTPEGVIHEFAFFTEMKSSTRADYVTSRTFTLNQSEYPNGQKIQYAYQRVPYSHTTNSNYFQSTFEETNHQSTFWGNAYHGSMSHRLDGDEALLESIRTTNFQVNFTLGSRQDISQGRRLEKIQISTLQSPSTVLREIRFEYAYFTAGSSNITQSLRLRLEKMYTCDPSTGTAGDVYGFTYNSTALPVKNSASVDYWGYYNGGTRSGTKLPDPGKLFFSRQDPQLSGLVNASQVVTRAAHPDYTAAAMLEGITYPTGGYTRFEYEANTFGGTYYPSETDQTTETLATVQDRNNKADVKTVEFLIEDETAEIELVAILSQGLNSWEDVKSSNVAILRLQSSPVLSVAVISFSSATSTETRKTLTVELTKGRCQLVASFPDALGDQYGASLNHGELSATASVVLTTREHSTGCGVRIKSISSYPAKTQTTAVKTTYYDYTDPSIGKSSGILHDQLYFMNTHHTYNSFIETRQINDPVPQYIYVNLRQVDLSSENRFSNPYGSSSGVGYSYVTEKTQADDSFGYTVHEFYNQQLSFTQHSVAIDNPLNGKSLSVKIYDKDRKLISQKEYTYRQNLRHTYFGINVEENYNRFPNLYVGGFPIYTLRKDMNLYSTSRFFIIRHQLPCYDITLASETETTDGVTMQTTYTYDTTTLQLREKSSTNSDGKTLRHTYTYANDYNTAACTAMKQAHRYNQVIEEKVFVDNYFVAAQANHYSTQGKPVLYNQYFSEISGLRGDVTSYSTSGVINADIYPSINIAYREHDSYGRPREVTRENLLHTVYLWGYNHQYPVAKIEGELTYQQVRGKLTAAYVDNLATSQNITQTTLSEIYTKLDAEKVQITTYTYQPLFGITSIQMPNRDILTYQYDPFGRLLKITDTHG
ncbi:MAG: hypothetical protein LIP08_07705, partial [Bacteroides sp.]|nr:hypothetical protein [Bacteroides sp.]